MDVREKLVELVDKARRYAADKCHSFMSCAECSHYGENDGNCRNAYIAESLIANGVTVQDHGYWETAVEVRDNTVCGNGVKIKYKRCSCCKNPAKFLEDDFCGNCGAKLDLAQPPKGE